jgi:hypothetical protein
MPYDGRHGGDHGRDRGRDRDGDRDHHRDHHRDRFGFFGFNVWPGYPYLPWWGWSDPYLWDNWDDSGDYDMQPGNYASQPDQQYAPGPYEPAPDDPEPQQQATPWPYSRPAPSAAPAPSLAPETPVTLVFRDGRPNEQVHNYLLTATTLSVLDRDRRNIPVDQIDIAETERLNRESGVDFSLPSSPR